MSADLFWFNGVDALSGAYLLPPEAAESVSRRARGFSLPPADLDELRYWHEAATERVLAPADGRDPCDLAQVGWGVVFPVGCDPAVRAALRVLLDHRRQQATAAGPSRFREFWGDDGYRPGESKTQFLARHGAAPGPVDPGRVPYYLLLVGDGREIPFSVQYQMDVQYAVGRLSFHTPEEYRRYAEGVVEAETSGTHRRRALGFFAPRNPDDGATERSCRDLVQPLARRLAADNGDWQVHTALAESATKQHLHDLLGGAQTPALLLTAGHGLGWPSGHPDQPRRQGALVCQEWSGPLARAPLCGSEYLGADDVPDDADLHGLIAFLFACYGAGTPEWDEFAHRTDGKQRARLAPDPLVSALPRRLLAHPRGAALAVAGHVDRAWGYSFTWPGAGRQTEVYRSCLSRLLRGHPIGSAFDFVNQRYAELSADLSAALEEVQYGRRPDHVLLSAMWTATNDARGFVVLGDPAVRLVVSPSLDVPGAAGVVRLSDAVPAVEGTPVPREEGEVAPPPPSPLAPAEAVVPAAGGSDLGSSVDRLTSAVQLLAAAVDRLTERLPAPGSPSTKDADSGGADR